MFFLLKRRLGLFPTLLVVLSLCLLPAAGRAQPSAPSSDPEKLGDLHLIDAVRMALSQQPDVFIAREAAAYQKGVYTEAGGPFDLTGEAALGFDRNRTDVGTPTPGGQWTGIERDQDAFSASLALNRKLRTGQTLSVETNGSQTDASLKGIPQTGPDNIGQIFFSVVQPLGKGRGWEATDAGEESARRQSEAAFYDLLYVLSQKAAEAAQAYFGCVAATQQLKILEEAETRARTLTGQISTLISKEELPAVEIAQTRANLADAKRSRILGEQTLFESRQQLLLAMGVEGRQLAAAVSCRDDFPALPDAKALRSFDPQGMVPVALKLRSDYLSQEWIESARQIFWKGTERNMAPQVDLKLKAGYGGYEPGSGASALGRSFTENVPGASVSMQVVAAWPFKNSAMKGSLMQARSLLDQAHWTKEKLDRQIRSDLMTGWARLKSKIGALDSAVRARENYETSFASEKKKYLLGMSTLINVLTVENQVTQAQLNVVQAQAEAAVALVSLRLTSGTLLSEEGKWITVRAEDLVRLPTNKVPQGNRLLGRAPSSEGAKAW